VSVFKLGISGENALETEPVKLRSIVRLGLYYQSIFITGPCGFFSFNNRLYEVYLNDYTKKTILIFLPDYKTIYSLYNMLDKEYKGYIYLYQLTIDSLITYVH